MTTKCVIQEKKEKESICVEMGEMKPGQIGIVHLRGSRVDGHVVLRNLSCNFEVMDLTDFTENACWIDQDITMSVELISKNNEVSVTFIN